MRQLTIVLLLAVACSGKNPAKDAATTIDDALPDSALACPAKPLLNACPTPVAGSTVTARSLGNIGGPAMLATSPPGDPRLFAVEQGGTIRIFDNPMPLGTPTLLPDPFLDISSSIAAGGERGLLGLAFHPCYESNGLFYVYYTTVNRNTVARCSVSPTDPNKANPTCTPILEIPDFAPNHNGGMIEFGKDGYLYIGTGDGGGGGDPQHTAQNTNSLLGKILRIDVDNKAAGKEYGYPGNNPYVAGGGAPEIFMLGLRNPWRWSFDTENGDMWIGDVGQGAIEELDVLKAGQQLGANLGWSMYEGTACFDPPCSDVAKVAPLDQRTHPDGWISIIGGQVYRGSCYPDLVGWYFYTDHGHGGLIKARLKVDDTLEIVDLAGTFPGGVASIHADSRGELYMTNIAGFVYHLEAAP